MAEHYEGKSEGNSRGRDNNNGGGRPYSDRPATNDRQPARPYTDRPARSNDRPSYGDRDNRGGQGGQGGRPSGDRPSYGNRDDRPARSGGDRPYGDRPARSNDRPSFGGRDDRGGQGGRPSGDRPSYGDRPARSNDRPSYGDRDNRGADRPMVNGRREDRKPFGDRDNRGGQGGRPSGDRPSYGDRPARSNDRPSGDRPSYGNRDDRGGRPSGDRPSYGGRDDRGGQGGRPSGDRPSFGGRDDRGGQGGRPSGDRPSYGDRPARSNDRPSGDRPTYGNRDDRPARSGGDRPYGDRPARSNDRPSGDRDNRGAREERGPRTAPERNAGDLRSSNRPDRDRSPHIDSDVTGEELDKVTRAQLRILDSRNNEWVSKHLVMAGRLIDFEPELAFEHALAASRRGGRLACVREAVAMTAYAAGKYDEALRELRTFRRISGSNVHLPLMADCERGLGRPDRALDLIKSEDAATLDTAGKVELAIVESGARGDLGELDAALSALEIPQLDINRAFSFSPRLFRAYGMVLRAADRKDEAKTWERQALVAEEALGIDDSTDQIIMDLGDDEDIPLDAPRARVRVSDVMAPATAPVINDAATLAAAELTSSDAEAAELDEPNVDDAESSYFESDDAESDQDSADEVDSADVAFAEGEDSGEHNNSDS
ncbi:hypothetical protein [Arthrobacter glacialis]|uniref:Tetratricopeptide repeat protein n=1 Tax=Arthrobacter glacialis TaxID=1664 RepID=A0A2S3ZVM7_ARTGL|nr:hypothetical protein [Arthrobacter glacialis]POH72927.1 hypothetical protein CVS27_13770 [Arthrobacter glacialis]